MSHIKIRGDKKMVIWKNGSEQNSVNPKSFKIEPSGLTLPEDFATLDVDFLEGTGWNWPADKTSDPARKIQDPVFVLEPHVGEININDLRPGDQIYCYAGAVEAQKYSLSIFIVGRKKDDLLTVYKICNQLELCLHPEYFPLDTTMLPGEYYCFFLDDAKSRGSLTNIIKLLVLRRFAS